MFLMVILQLSIQLLSVQSISKILTKSSAAKDVFLQLGRRPVGKVLALFRDCFRQPDVKPLTIRHGE